MSAAGPEGAGAGLDGVEAGGGGAGVFATVGVGAGVGTVAKVLGGGADDAAGGAHGMVWGRPPLYAYAYWSHDMAAL